MRMAMKLKYYLRGAGIGIVATTLVFSIANAVSSANKRLVTGTEQTSTESSILAYTQKDTQAETIKQEEETTKEQTTAVQEETTTQEETTIGQETTAATEASEPETQGQPQTRAALYLPGDEVQIEIGSGYTATQVADMFLSAGIISDRDGLSVIWQRPATQPK